MTEEARWPSCRRRQLGGAVGVPQEPFLVLTHAEHRPPMIFWANLLALGGENGVRTRFQLLASGQ